MTRIPLRLTLAALLVAAPALAQEPDSTVSDSVPLYRLEGITVTVTRSQERLDRLPYAASVIDRIQELQATLSLDESLLQVPGVMIDNRHNFALGNRISIRGYGARSQFGVRGLRIIQDGIPLTLPDGQAQLNNIDLAAAGRIEVIRGPASSLYGNASGGVIKIRTASPPPVLFQPEIRLLGGGYGEDRYYQKYDLTGGGRSGGLEYVTHLSHFQTDGFRLHSAAEQTLFNTRVGYQLNERSELEVVINYTNTPFAQNPSSLSDSLARAVPDTARDIVLGPGECPPNPGFGGCQNLGETSKQGQAGITYRRRLGHAHTLSLMGYGLMRELENPIPFTLIQLDRRAGGARVEYRYLPLDGVLAALTAGVDLDHQADDRQEFARDDQGVGAIQLDQDERVTGLGLFAHGRWRLGPRLEVTTSARYDRVRFRADDDLVTATDPDDSGTRIFEQVSPMIGLSYAHSTAVNAYVNVGRSFQTPTTTELTDTLGGFNQRLESEKATNYEVGLKGSVGERLSYTLAVFVADIEDQLILFQPEGIDRDFFENAGSSDHRGVEMGLSALLAPGLTLSGAYTYSNFEFDRFQNQDGDFSGNEVPGIAPHRFHGRLRYEHGSGLTGSLELTASDGFFVDNANQQRNEGYAVIDLRLGYRVRLSGMEAAPFLGLNNAFDGRYNSSVVINAFGARYFEPAPGRNLYLGVGLKTR
ncbi:MAG: TonB-dependent receptor [Gemmatimonadetes bacterium]|uniref:TonB-dependent receptor n=1 Tax=Candidatus Kutchimonas denitrificans TaxID=3056748 RepID=A0AAE4Z4J3_9BACT|nr:TonB-dependent receptor [Gemmatimonadota bacterium]NIR73625.1 TonB-dependent receptor [Candidatus Kutchimonas denitrificans]NIR99584.1 TonB-dependent receptor [Gemmatimonadota bacterium]NIT65204.1 TonB-dependent receptor [Gemmatimonadota bacterium]NIV23737.1 TonB-dependent receptor [Gemmatimonadota bacterium]